MQKNVVKNARVLAEELMKRGFNLVGGGTENHLILADMEKSFGIDGKFYEIALDEVGITLNANTLPRSDAPAFRPSGVRLGTPAITTRGLGEVEMRILAEVMEKVAKICAAVGEMEKLNEKKVELDEIKEQVRNLALKFPLPHQKNEGCGCCRDCDCGCRNLTKDREV